MIDNQVNLLNLANFGLYEFPKNLDNINYLDLSGNHITEIPYLPKTVHYLNISFNPISNFDFLKNSNVKVLISQGVKYVDFQCFPDSLEMLDCSHCNLKFLPFLNNIKMLKCKGNKLTSLNINEGITNIQASKNMIENINFIPKSLKYLDLRFNKIKFLPPLNENLKNILLEKNPLNIEQLPILPSSFMFYGNAMSVFKNIKDLHKDTAIKYLNGYTFPFSLKLKPEDIKTFDDKKFETSIQYKCEDLIEFDEYDVKDYITKNIDNIIISSNKKLYCYKRSELKKYISLEDNQICSTVSGEILSKLYMREYININELNIIQSYKYSIFELEYKKQISFKDKNDTVYSIKPYTCKSYFEKIQNA